MTDSAINAAWEKIWRQAEFMLSGAALRDLPREGREVAFAGRSNAGKSTALNALTGRSGLARTSKRPGRTQLINLFSLADEYRLADLPGYGFARAPVEVKAQWIRLIGQYFAKREALVGVVLIIDIRREITELDRQLLDWLQPTGLPVHVLLTKCDKLSRGQASAARHKVQRDLESYTNEITVQLFSGSTRAGVDDARARIGELLGLGV